MADRRQLESQRRYHDAETARTSEYHEETELQRAIDEMPREREAQEHTAELQGFERKSTLQGEDLLEGETAQAPPAGERRPGVAGTRQGAAAGQSQADREQLGADPHDPRRSLASTTHDVERLVKQREQEAQRREARGEYDGT